LPKRWLEQTRRSAPDALDPVRGRPGSGLVGGEAIVSVLWLRAVCRGTDDRAPEARDLPDKPPPQLHRATRVGAFRTPASASRWRSPC
jgi:hypothetical protein